MDVGAWLRDLGLERYEETLRDNEVDARSLPHLTADDLKEMGVTAIGHRRLLLQAIADLQEGGAPAVEPGSQRVISSEDFGDTTSRASKAERRQLTVMFVDLVGSTELSARLDPEDLGRLIRSYQQTCAGVIDRWDGHVAKHMGDGVLAYFGWPQAHEDDAERSVRAALELVKLVATLKSDEVPLAARIGIATGQVMVGDLIGEGTGQEVVGETPNLAARLQAVAGPSAVVVAANTRRLLGGLFELHDLGPQTLKGFAAPVHAFRVVAESGAESRFDAMHGTRLAPLVGREHELGLLLDRWQKVEDGEGQVVLLSGEAGIGKSRLVHALRGRLERRPHTLVSYYGSPFHTNSALFPAIGLLERAGDLRPDDSLATKLAKLERLLGRGTRDLNEAVPLVAALLGIETGGAYPVLELTPQRQKQRTLEVLVEQIEGIAAAERPVLALYEDAHCFDPTTLETLDLLIARAARLPVLVLITFRPEFSAPWTRHANVTQLSLARLGRREVSQLVARVTGGKPLPDGVLRQIQDKTDGVPLFVEELTKTVLESGLFDDVGDHLPRDGPLPGLAIPATLHDSLMARLDRHAGAKEIAQIGACAGRDFSHQLLATVAERPEAELDNALTRLIAAELLFRRGTPPDATYVFKHALVQDAAYQSLLRSKRMQLHARIARALEQRFPQTVATEPETLARHYQAAGFPMVAISYWQKAGERAEQRSALGEAASHLGKGLDLLATMPDDVEHARRELELQIALGAVLLMSKGHAAPDVAAAYARARDLCIQLDERKRLFWVLLGLWRYNHVRPVFVAARDLAKELLDLAEHDDDPYRRAVAHYTFGATALFHGDLQIARQHLEMATIPYSQPAGPSAMYRPGADPAVAGHIKLGQSLWLLGYVDKASRCVDAGLAHARHLNHPFSLAFGLLIASFVDHFQRDDERARRRIDESVEIASEQGFQLILMLGRIQGEWAAPVPTVNGLERMRQALAACRTAGVGVFRPYYLALLAEACVRIGEIDQAMAAMAEAREVVVENDEHWWEAEVHRRHGMLLLARSSSARGEAENALRRALDIARSQQARSVELRAAKDLAKIWAEHGERQKAHDLLAHIYGWFTEGFDTPDLKDAQVLLDGLA